MADRRVKRNSARRFNGQPRIVAWCAWRGCSKSVPAAVGFCPKHLHEAIRKLRELGLTRPDDELIPETLRPRSQSWSSGDNEP